MNWFDIILIILLLVGGLEGFRRGFFREIRNHIIFINFNYIIRNFKLHINNNRTYIKGNFHK